MIFHYWWNCDQLPNHTQHNWGADFKDLDTSKHDVFCPKDPCAYLLWVLRNGVSKFDEIWIFTFEWNFGLFSRKDQDSWEAHFWRITTSSHAAFGCKKLSWCLSYLLSKRFSKSGIIMIFSLCRWKLRSFPQQLPGYLGCWFWRSEDFKACCFLSQIFMAIAILEAELWQVKVWEKASHKVQHRHHQLWLPSERFRRLAATHADVRRCRGTRRRWKWAEAQQRWWEVEWMKWFQ